MTKIIFILISKVENKNPSQKDLDDSVERLLKAASILEQEMNLTLNEGEYLENSTSLLLR